MAEMAETKDEELKEKLEEIMGHYAENARYLKVFFKRYGIKAESVGGTSITQFMVNGTAVEASNEIGTIKRLFANFVNDYFEAFVRDLNLAAGYSELLRFIMGDNLAFVRYDPSNPEKANALYRKIACIGEELSKKNYANILLQCFAECYDVDFKLARLFSDDDEKVLLTFLRTEEKDTDGEMELAKQAAERRRVTIEKQNAER